MIRFCLYALLTFLVSGCSILNPYHEDFDCRADGRSGRCVNSMQAYSDAKHEEAFDNIMPQPSDLQNSGETSRLIPGNKHTDYENSLYQQLSDLIKKPKTPVRIPPKIIRVLFVPYQGKNGELFMPRHAFIEVDKGKWVLDGDLIEPER